jgi:cytochrome c oxidase subunit II
MENRGFEFLPEQASQVASQVDLLYGFIWAVTIFFTVLIFLLIAYFSIKYRRRSPDERPQPVLESLRLELFYTIVPFLITMVIFFWGVKVFFQVYGQPSANAMDVHVVGKQWMWKMQHPEGPREINTLHVPVGREVQLTLSSQDVIHSFFVPAFRVKLDAVPGKYTRMSFTPTKVGTYHLFCAEYCGTQHSGMIGSVVVMEPADYDAWLTGTTPSESPAASGARLFQTLGCATCHGVQAPSLAGLYGSQVRYTEWRAGTGQVKQTTADEQYLRESILESTAKIVEGYQPIMPSFRSQVSEEQVLDLIAYIKSLKTAKADPAAGSGQQPNAPDKTPRAPGAGAQQQPGTNSGGTGQAGQSR